jgi:peptide/nickel transport system permease protein
VIAGLVMVCFIAAWVIGDPVDLLTDKEFTTQAERDALAAAAGFDRPLHRQFLDYAGGVVRGDFGTSVWQNRPAAEVVLERVPATVLLAAVALAVTALVTVPAAVFAGRHAGRWPETVVTALATAAASTASFWWGLVLILVLAVRFQLLPTSGYGSWEHIVLPVLALTPQPIGRITQVLGTNVAGELRQQYVGTARSKGLRERTVMRRHVLRNTAIVGVTLFGGELAALLNGAVLVESIFAWPGVGQVALTAVQRRDLPVLMASVFYVGVLVTMLNLLVDLMYAWLDPRIRFA